MQACSWSRICQHYWAPCTPGGLQAAWPQEQLLEHHPNNNDPEYHFLHFFMKKTHGRSAPSPPRGFHWSQCLTLQLLVFWKPETVSFSNHLWQGGSAWSLKGLYWGVIAKCVAVSLSNASGQDNGDKYLTRWNRTRGNFFSGPCCTAEPRSSLKALHFWK